MPNEEASTNFPEIDPRELRNALGGFITGVTVVTTEVDGTPIGFTASSFTSVSLSPPLVLVCIGKSSSNFTAFTGTDHFCINILAEGQRDVSQQFSAKNVDRFANLNWTSGVLGSPVIEDSIASFQCTLHQRVDAGDHDILIGRVVKFDQGKGSPLGYCRGNYVLFELEQKVLDSGSHSSRFGAILETSEGVVFEREQGTGKLVLPNTSLHGTREAKEGLYAKLTRLGLEFDLEFLFSVWESDKADQLNVYYRGNARSVDKVETVTCIPIDEIPLDELGYDDMRLLRRYREERKSFRFSVYAGTSTSGPMKFRISAV